MIERSRLRGSMTALGTPFDAAGALDEAAFRAFVDWQVEEGTKGLVPVGTTGESPTLSHD
ncbi:MAG: dihydrodipicolinate synthase family protein, partial [Roseitalea sp.]|nr:dihydrodipicolinate synthase family protein [Roseitalea sp.]